jgi:DNA-binding sugar fermentation-stimulating protein
MNKETMIQLEVLIEGLVIKRPSKFIKTPYVADVLINENSEIEKKEVIAHSASLGCCGLADANARVLMSAMPPSKTKNPVKCSHRIYLSICKEGDNEEIIGIYPKLAETLAEAALNQNLLSSLKNLKTWRRETTIKVADLGVDSRFDFSGIDENGNPFIMEIKNVPLADYEDISAKDRKKMNFEGRDFNSKVAYFPDGYRKKSTDPVSPRALKHIRELEAIHSSNPKIRCILCFVIQRADVNRFTTSVVDPEYKAAVKKAHDSGVEILTMVIKWSRDGIAQFIRDDLPIFL